MSDITRDEVAHLAELARIDLSDAEISSLTDQLGQILQAVAQVNEVATPDVPATSHPIPLTNVFREDIPGETLTTEQVFGGAPDVEEHMFRVPSILGDAPATKQGE
ncbi:MAG: Asp-tRNA(Asn)/Glu-tRNA(Gln) amidotransferase subunit GatC [Microbacteriaceae bacterium]|jgi:aspartyl-tRNA(Asn)/glutamyl-tRNA(Gln) amidotransferase subunit C|nr:Asp-tRNA(Asn)/Glu-tRNA(Gln) amidotransferase subunit GatC [Microbacteriaceae bacterium]MCI1207561.1 Asp-tRNA(Asn)/Glu-tRNA(Gln) amidotransferase subunit GatC [Microbacteriaceae bacterium]